MNFRNLRASRFIKFTASKSLLSGKPYFIKTKEGKILPSKEWFMNVLSQYRKKKAGPGTKAGD
jgi:hypothetical protein